jgi:glycosyltransferase involved in cell wall biosynthesis
MGRIISRSRAGCPEKPRPAPGTPSRYTSPMPPADDSVSIPLPLPVSVILTELNEIEDIARVVASLLAQDPPAGEVIVVDGGSTDGTWEWLAAESKRNPLLVAVRDQTCSLKFSPGPVSRGRNVAIRAARFSIIACADAGCTYAPDWLRNLTAPLVAGTAEYALGGAMVDPANHTVWDLASAPFFSIKLAPDAPTKSCTARSMAFSKSLWQRIGGFPEDVLVGEDTLFDAAARRLAAPAFIPDAKALYHPRNTFRSATHQMARYATSDGQARIRWPRLFRNAARCLLQIASLVLLRWSFYPFLAVLLLEFWYAYHRDLRDLLRFGPRALPGALLARFAFSVAIPWVVAVNHLLGLFSTARLSNRQNLSSS